MTRGRKVKDKYKICVICNKYKIIESKNRCINCAQNERYKNKVNKSSIINCQCSPNCPTKIHSIDKKGRITKYAHGHQKRAERNHNWQGGWSEDIEGYIRVKHPQYDRIVKEHRLVYEEYYNCCLLPWVDIHHINGFKKDNRIENLQPMYHRQHVLLHWSDR